MSTLQGKNSDITIEKFVLKNLKIQKKQRIKKMKENNKSAKENAERMAYFKLKKEPEKNKTHWDHLLEEMKWMQNDFDKERKLKRKKAAEMCKFTKRAQETKHLEVEKKAKRMEQETRKLCQMMSKNISTYWKKIEKLTKYHYNVILQENKITQQQNRLLSFINKLQKISTRVADFLTPQKNPNKSLPVDSTKMSVDSESQADINEDDFVIQLKKHEDGTFSFLENNQEENIVAKAAHTAELFQPKGTELAKAKVDLEQPFLLKHNLREYQLIGLNWLIALHDNKINGILADEMGLGKTIQTISMLAYLAGTRGSWGPHLIIVPTTIIINWEIEFKKWCPGLKILSYYGSQKERKAKRYGWHKPNAFNICITSYKLVIQDYSIFKRKRWYYIILDEAQNIKNFKSKRWQMLLNFKAKRKLLLTGTPLQNDVMEIWSYLHFLMPNLFESNEEFRDWFYSQFYNAIHNNAALNKKMIQSLHSILRPFLLRRLKKDVEKQLPEKIEHVVYCELTGRQKLLYDEYINSDRTQDTLRHNDYFSLMNVLMQLRKVCNHPDLFDTRDYVTSNRQLFEIFVYIPHLVMRMFSYNPMKTLNLKNLNLILEENEKITNYDYIEILKNFPTRPLNELFTELHDKKRLLYNPKYLIDENDILFKRDFSDSTILYGSSTREYSLISNVSNPSKIYSNLPYPRYLCPTNVPLLNNTSLSCYFDMFNPINSLDLKNPQSYLKTVFHENIESQNEKKYEIRKKLIHEYDLISRKNIIYKCPIYGADILKKIKILNSINMAHNLSTKNQILYGREFKNFQNNLINSILLNQGFKKILLSGDELYDNLGVTINNLTYEAIQKEEKHIDLNDLSQDIEIQIEAENKQENNQMDVDQIIVNSNDKEKANNPENKSKLKNFKNITHIRNVREDFKSEFDPNFTPKDSIHFLNSDAISHMTFTPQKMMNICESLMNYFRIFVPKVISSGPQLIQTKLNIDYNLSKNRQNIMYNNLNRIPNVQKYLSMFKIISFPDKRLVEYDSGKLIKLAELLKKLKKNKSKVLIFTQMTRMLDILERFLNLHGYTYVRLDGSTKVEVRQQVVDRFNNDPKIFCFISSTRSGGIGLNLTGADSIVFYDTDWNPAMDKQAQDRCHRIGQTRTVHIYRLITLSTIEENIFRKSIQKRELNYVIMEDGKFDTSHFKKINFKSIIQEENLLRGEEKMNVVQPSRGDEKIKKLLEFENLAFENEEEQKNIEQMLIRIEDQEDVQALKNLSKEMLDEYEKENNELQFINDEVFITFYIILTYIKFRNQVKIYLKIRN